MAAIDTIRDRLAEQGISLPEDTEIRRTYAGPWQKKNGAWTWFLWSSSAPNSATFGSQFPMTRLAKCKHWQVDPVNRISPDRAIEPCGDC